MRLLCGGGSGSGLLVPSPVKLTDNLVFFRHCLCGVFAFYGPSTAATRPHACRDDMGHLNGCSIINRINWQSFEIVPSRSLKSKVTQCVDGQKCYSGTAF